MFRDFTKNLRRYIFGDLQGRLVDCEISISDLKQADEVLRTVLREVLDAWHRLNERGRVVDSEMDSLHEDIAKLDLRWVGINKRLDECKCPPADVAKEIADIKNWMRVLHSWTVKISERVSAFTPAPQPAPEPYEAYDA